MKTFKLINTQPKTRQERKALELYMNNENQRETFYEENNTTMTKYDFFLVCGGVTVIMLAIVGGYIYGSYTL